MLDRPRWTRHGQGLALLFGTLFMALSLVGYDPADAPGLTVWHARPEPPHNPCGPVGASLAHYLAQTVGVGSWFVLWGMIVATALIFRKRAIPEPVPLLSGFLLVLASGAALIQTFLPTLQPSPPVGSGGYIGGFAAAFLGTQFGPVGRLLILGAVALLGIALCHETVIGWPAREILRVTGLAHRLRLTRSREATPLAPSSVWPALTSAVDPCEHVMPLQTAPVARLLPAPARPAGTPQETRRAEPRATIPVPYDGSFAVPPLELLDPLVAMAIGDHETKIQERALLLEKTLREHGCIVRVVQIDTGPVVTQFEIELEAGLRISKVAGLSNDLAIALAVPSVRIVAPIP